MKGQSTIEFLTIVSFMLLVFILSISMYALFVEEAGQMSDDLEAYQRCTHISSSIVSLAVLGGTSIHTFNLSPYLNGKNYIIWIASNASRIKIDYGSRSVGCSLPIRNITDADGATLFSLAKNATLRNNFGVLTLET